MSDLRRLRRVSQEAVAAKLRVKRSGLICVILRHNPEHRFFWGPEEYGMAVSKGTANHKGTGAAKSATVVPIDRHTRRKASAAEDPARAAPKAAEQLPPDDGDGRDSYAVTALADIIDRSLHAAAARFTLGASPAALAEAYFDWATHLAFSPGKRVQLVDKAARKAARLATYAYRCAADGEKAAPCIEPLPQDRRFAADAWKKWPYNLLYQGFLLNQQWWHNATTGIRGVTKQHENMVEFTARQVLDMFSPSNFLLTNPEVLQHTVAKGGVNLVSGFQNMMEDWERAVSGKKPVGAENFRPGHEVAATPGKVIYRNRLIELIQYAPGDRQGAAGASADRAGLDHEVLHPRSLAAQFAGQIPDRAGVHRLHDLLEEPRPGRTRPWPRRLPDARRDGGA